MPSIRVEAWVPEPHARLVVNHLADATRLRVEDTTRLWIEPTTPNDHRVDEVERTDTVDPTRATGAPAPGPPPTSGASVAAPQVVAEPLAHRLAPAVGGGER